MERLTNRDREIPLPKPENAVFWASAHEKLAQYEDAEEAGKLLILPCKVGDMVYYRRGSYIIGDDVKRIVLDGIDNQVIIDHNHSFMFSDFGRKVWSSREEAETAMKGEHNAN